MTERPWSMGDEARDRTPRAPPDHGPAGRLLRRAVWLGLNLYVGWWTVFGTVLVMATLTVISGRTAGSGLLLVVGALFVVAMVAGAAIPVAVLLRPLVRDVPRRRFVGSSAVTFAARHLYLLAVAAGVDLPWRLPAW